MNNNLPPEILHFIFIQLPLRDRLNCTLVCRHWYRALQKRSLLYDLEISHKERLDKLMDLLHRLPSRGNQVEILEVNGDIDFDCRNFCNMFPNLRVFLNDNLKRPDNNYFSQSFQLAASESKLNTIKDRGECELTRQLLVSARYTHLTDLYVILSDIEDPRSDFFPLLDDLPALESFGVSECDFGILDCEIIHDSAPSIRNLLLHYLHIKIDPLPANITPVTSVTELDFISDGIGGDDENHIRWYKYLSKKYTDLTTFDFHDYILVDNDPGLSRQVYEAGLIPLYKNSGSRLKHLKVHGTHDDIGLCNILDGFGCKIQSVDFLYNDDESIFSQFAHSNQSKYIEKVSLLHTDFPSPSLLANMVSLQSIDLGLSGVFPHSTNLTEYMNAFPPSLMDFSVTCAELEFSNMPTNINNIETLTIRCSTLPTMLDEAISTCCPKLTNLTIEGGVEESMKIQLPNNHLETLDIKAYHMHQERKLGFLLKYTNCSQTLCFVEKPDTLNARCPRLEFGEIKQLKGRTTIEIECASANDLCLKVYEKSYILHWF